MTCCILGREKLASQLPKLMLPPLLSELTNVVGNATMCPRGWSSACNSATGAIRAALLGSSAAKMKFLQKSEGINGLAAGFCGECKKTLLDA